MEHEVFVFGSNREGRHGAGAAKFAREKHGAIYGQAEGLQGNSYAIVTKELRHNKEAVTLEEVAEGVSRFLIFAQESPHLQFRVTPIGCGLAGFRPTRIAPLFAKRTRNVILPEEFLVRSVHCKRDQYDLYIGRPGPFGNKFKVGVHGERGECIGLFESWFGSSEPDAIAYRQLIDERITLGMRLGCWCHPNGCHGDVIANYVNNKGLRL